MFFFSLSSSFGNTTSFSTLLEFPPVASALPFVSFGCSPRPWPYFVSFSVIPILWWFFSLLMCAWHSSLTPRPVVVCRWTQRVMALSLMFSFIVLFPIHWLILLTFFNSEGRRRCWAGISAQAIYSYIFLIYVHSMSSRIDLHSFHDPTVAKVRFSIATVKLVEFWI